MMPPRLHERRILVVGGSSGLGEAVVRRAVDQGAQVLAVARRGHTLQSLQASLPRGSVETLACDITDDVAAGAVSDRVHEVWGALDGAFIGHGGPASSSALALDDEALNAALGLAAVAPIRMMRTAATLAAPGASLIALTSSTGVEPLSGMAPSNVARPAVQAYAKTLARELGPRGVRVNVLIPGRFETPRLKQLAEQGVAAPSDNQSIPLGRTGEPDELAAVACFLLSTEASYVTGASWTVDGGRRVTM